MKTSLQSKIALVTGAGSGIGYATALALAEEGCSVVLVDRVAEVINKLAKQQPDVFISVVSDLSSENAPAAIMQQIKPHWLPDILVLSAGVYETSELYELSAGEWDKVHSINLRSNFLLAQATLPFMCKRGWGRVVTLSSIAAETGGVSAGAAYVASKAGVIGLTRSLALTGAANGVTVNAVSPGLIASPMTSGLTTSKLNAIAAQTPMGRLGTPEDVAKVVCCVVSDAFAFVTGQVIPVNGGLHLR